MHQVLRIKNDEVSRLLPLRSSCSSGARRDSKQCTSKQTHRRASAGDKYCDLTEQGIIMSATRGALMAGLAREDLFEERPEH